MRQFRILAQIALAFILVGCAAERKQVMEVQQLQTRISDLESELQQKNEEILNLEQSLEKMQQKRVSSSYKENSKTSKKTSRNIQIALKNSGHYVGPIDGKIGKKTTQAIKKFQKAKGLTVDGVVGKQTWLELQRYLN